MVAAHGVRLALGSLTALLINSALTQSGHCFQLMTMAEAMRLQYRLG